MHRFLVVADWMQKWFLDAKGLALLAGTQIATNSGATNCD